MDLLSSYLFDDILWFIAVIRLRKSLKINQTKENLGCLQPEHCFSVLLGGLVLGFYGLCQQRVYGLIKLIRKMLYENWRSGNMVLVSIQHFPFSSTREILSLKCITGACYLVMNCISSFFLSGFYYLTEVPKFWSYTISAALVETITEIEHFCPQHKNRGTFNK